MPLGLAIENDEANDPNIGTANAIPEPRKNLRRSIR
jgi:hypothetical protein